MAKSEFEYVREQERDDRLPKLNWIIVRIHANDFRRFSKTHNFDDPNDQRPLNLMNSSAISLLDQFPDIVFAYGFGSEFSFIWKPTSTFYERRESKILSLTISLFTSTYVMRWKEFCPDQEIESPPSFEGKIICIPGPSGSLVRDYLSFRQFQCHVANQNNTCSWMLLKSGRTESDVAAYLEGMEESEKNELLFQQFGINYNSLPAILRKGSLIFKNKVEEIVKTNEEGKAVMRERKKIRVEHNDMKGRGFWKNHPEILPL